MKGDGGRRVYLQRKNHTTTSHPIDIYLIFAPRFPFHCQAGLGLNCDFAWEVLQKSQDGDAKFIRNGDFAWEVLPKWQDDDVKRTCLARYLLIKVCKNLRKMKVFAMLRHLACILVSSSILEPSWGHLGALLGSSWAHLGAILGPCWAILGPCWAILGPPWAILGLLRAKMQSKSENLDFP